MCGRARCTVRVDDVGRVCGFSAPLRTLDSDRFNPSYNVSPGRYMPVVRHAAQAGDAAKDGSVEPVVQCMKWGLVPSFTKKNEKPDHFRMFNARSESVHLKPSFCRLLPKSRCVTTVEGFYEWKKDGSKKQPYYVHFKDGHPLVFAGLYDTWKDEEGNVLHTFTILTTRSSKALDWLHDRMPVILPDQKSVNSWLNDDLNESALHKITQPYEAPDLVWYPVTPAMGKPAFDSPECVKELKPKVAGDSNIAKLFGKVHTESESTVEHEGVGDHFTGGPEVPEKGTLGSIADGEGEGFVDEYEKKSLLAGVMPDHDIPQDLETEQEGEKFGALSKKSEAPVEGNTDKSRMQTDTGHKGAQTQLYSPVKQKRKDSPSPAKRQRLTDDPKTTNKKGGQRPSQNTQSNLLSFYGKT